MAKYLDSDGNLKFGTYRGEAVADVAGDDPDYLRFLLDKEDLTEQETAVITDALA